MLSFLFYYLIKTPLAYQKIREEVDRVVGRGPVTVEHLSKLPYIEACLRETLRLTPTAPAFALQPRPDNTEDPIIIGGKYAIGEDQTIVALLGKVHRDQLVYGDDAEDFRPERMADEPFSKLPPNSWKPFGNGMRGCIGRPFAWQESLLTVALLFQTFDFRFEDPSYQLRIKQTLTIKPGDFFMHATLRKDIDPVQLEKMLHVGVADQGKENKDHSLKDKVAVSDQKPLTILYGSNAGTCEALSQSLAREASAKGFKAEVNTLDSAVDSLPSSQPVIIICSSYEGQPPDNAAHFVTWLESLGGGDKLKGINYAVFGCGSREHSISVKAIRLTDSIFQMTGSIHSTEFPN